MALTAAQMLDELMGKDRNLVPGEKSAQVHWSHEDACKNFLCGFCPHDLFVNTKADLGPCSKVHDDMLKTDYEKSGRYGRMGYEEDFFHFLSNVQADVDRKIHRGHDRLMMNKAREQEMSKDDSDKTKMLTDHINQLLEEIEQLGSEGKVEEAQGVAKLVDQLKDEKEQSKLNPGSSASQEKQMEVCEVCGAFLIVGDAQSRVDDHLQGKQHVGYARIKTTIEELKARSWLKPKEKVEEEVKDEKKKETKEEGPRPKERKRERSREKDRRSRDGSRDRDRRRRSKSREKSRGERRRSRDRSNRSDRDKERRRERSRESRDSRRSSRRSRSRSPRKPNRRSRSRDRSRDRRRSRNSSKDRKDERSPKRSETEDNKSETNQSVQSKETADIHTTNDKIERSDSTEKGEGAAIVSNGKLSTDETNNDDMEICEEGSTSKEDQIVD